MDSRLLYLSLLYFTSLSLDLTLLYCSSLVLSSTYSTYLLLPTPTYFYLPCLLLPTSTYSHLPTSTYFYLLYLLLPTSTAPWSGLSTYFWTVDGNSARPTRQGIAGMLLGRTPHRIKGLFVGRFLPIFTDLFGLSWETSTFNNCHPEDFLGGPW